MSSFKSFHFKLCIFTLILLSLTSLVACDQKRSESPPPLTVEMLKNAEYHSEFLDEGSMAKLTDGKYKKEFVPGAGPKFIAVDYLGMQAFGDLNGDSVEDAAVVLSSCGGGSGVFMSLEAVINDKGTPKNVATAFLGDRTQVKSVVIESGEITVDMVTHCPHDPMACPTVETTQKYKLEGDRLIQISPNRPTNTGQIGGHDTN